jgi:hypothetical protein
MTETNAQSEQKASCACGALTVATRGQPLEVFACSCLNCQRESGSAFTYSAVYPQADVSLSGERKTWRRTVDSGRWLESEFCPTCGVTVSFHMEAWPEVTGVPVGCFADPDFAGPDKLFWATRRHHWLRFPEETEQFETQSD